MRLKRGWIVAGSLGVASTLLFPVAGRAKMEFSLPENLQDRQNLPWFLKPTTDENGNKTQVFELSGEFVHNCGNVLMNITNFGLLGSLPGTNFATSNAPSFQWPKGSQTEYLWGAGLWVGALKNGEPRVSTGIFDFFELWPKPADPNARIYETQEGALGGGRFPAPLFDDDRDGLVDEDKLDGIDNDGDGKIDEDFAAISNQMFFAEMTDSEPGIKAGLPEHVPLEILVQQSTLCWETPLVDDFIAFDFRIINQGVNPLDQVYIGFFADFDLGPRGQGMVAQDDWAGFWEGVREARQGTTTRNVKISIGYMFDDDTDAGETEGYVGLMFLGAQDPGSDDLGASVGLRNFRSFSGRATFENGGDANNDNERYQILSGTAPRSLPPADPNSGFRPAQLARRADDYRVAVSAGPFEFVASGDTLTFQAAIVIGQFFEGMIENAVQAQLTYDGAYLDCDDDPLTGVGGRESPVCGPENRGFVRINPCDSLCDFAPSSDEDCFVAVPLEGCVFVNGDCEIERQLSLQTGIDGKECVVRWLIGTAPPPPNMRIVAKENQIEILWDNRSETTPDLRLNVIDFESYRIWRADNWTRPLGTSIRTGPPSSLWGLLAEFDLPRNGIGSDRGLQSIRYDPVIPAHAVEFYREWFRAHPFQAAPDLPGFSKAQRDTAQSLARGARYYSYVDPPFLPGGRTSGPCPSDGCLPILDDLAGPLNTRCNRNGVCQETAPPPHSGAHYFYSVTATDHKLELGPGFTLVPAGLGLAGEPTSNFVFVNPPSSALAPERFDQAAEQIYVVPNPATVESMKPWKLEPNNDDPTGTKIEFRHLPQSTGVVTVFTLAGDRVQELNFDGTGGNGTLAWDLVSRNGQDVTSGVYLYSVESDDPNFKRFVGKFVVVR